MQKIFQLHKHHTKPQTLLFKAPNSDFPAIKCNKNEKNH